MRGNPQVAAARLRAVTPARRWSAWITRIQERHRQSRIEQLEVIARMRAEERRSRRSGAHVRDVPGLHRWS